MLSVQVGTRYLDAYVHDVKANPDPLCVLFLTGS